MKRYQGLLDKNVYERITLDGNNLKTVGRLSYLEDVLSTEGGRPQAVTRSAWKKFKDIFSILCKKGMSLRIKDILYKSHVRSARSYNAEC